MGVTNLGRVQGGSVFYSTATSGTTISKSTLSPSNITPLLGDSVLFPNGDIRKITAIGSTSVTCGGVLTSIKGATGNSGVTGVKGNAESSYRVGNVNITPANIGAVASSDLLPKTYPVGSIYEYDPNKNSKMPMQLFGGNWEDISDEFTGVPYRVSDTGKSVYISSGAEAQLCTIQIPSNCKAIVIASVDANISSSSFITMSIRNTTTGQNESKNMRGIMTNGGGLTASCFVDSACTLKVNIYASVATTYNAEMYALIIPKSPYKHWCRIS